MFPEHGATGRDVLRPPTTPCTGPRPKAATGWWWPRAGCTTSLITCPNWNSLKISDRIPAQTYLAKYPHFSERFSSKRREPPHNGLRNGNRKLSDIPGLDPMVVPAPNQSYRSASPVTPGGPGGRPRSAAGPAPRPSGGRPRTPAAAGGGRRTPSPSPAAGRTRSQWSPASAGP